MRSDERLRNFAGMLLAASIAAGGAWILNDLRRLPHIQASSITIAPSTQPATAVAAPGPAEIFARCSPAVVRVFAFDAQGQRGQGSGFILSDDGLIVTNNHVIDGRSLYQIVLGDDRLIGVNRVVAVDRAADLALLKVDATGLSMLTLSVGAASSDTVPSIGTRVYAIGSPRDLSNTLSEGIVSGLRRETPGVTHIQTTAPISPGSSGGPLLDETGRVIGVTSAFRADGQNLNFAIDAGRVSELLDLGRFYLESLKAPGSPRWWLAHALRNASRADETRPTVFLAIGQAAIDAGDTRAAAWAARFAERAGLCGGDTIAWQIPVAQLYRKTQQPERAARLIELAGVPQSEIDSTVVHEDRPTESERKLVLACADRAAANQIGDACDIASSITSWRQRAEAVRSISRALSVHAAPTQVLSWIEQQGDGWESSQLRAIGCLGPVDAQRRQANSAP
jgi:hypothetical protein